MFGQTLPQYFTQLNLLDKFILFEDIRPAFRYMGCPDEIIDGYISYFKKHKMNADEEVQLYFHNNSFKGADKEFIMLQELTFNPDQTLPCGIYSAIDSLKGDEGYAEVIIPWVNEFNRNPALFNQLVLESIQYVALQIGLTAPVHIDAFGANSMEELLINISDRTGDDGWRVHYRDERIAPVKDAFYKRRDNDDTDKAIYRMCCIGLIDDVIIDYNNELYKVMVRKKDDDFYFNTLRSFFEKYYSVEQAHRKANDARNHQGSQASDKCMYYLTEFIYENLAVKRRRAIDDMRDACIKGALQGDDELKNYIHLYFNSKYARDTHIVDGQNFSLRQDIKNGLRVLDILWKYVNVMNLDRSGTENDNLKHLYGAVLIILRDQVEDHSGNTALFLLRSFCLACLGTNNNETLIEEFKEGYDQRGLNKIISDDNINDPVFLYNQIELFNRVVETKAHDEYIKDYVKNMHAQLMLRIVNRFFKEFMNNYTDSDINNDKNK